MQVGLIGSGNMARALGRGTARGLAALERAGVRPAFHDAIDAVASWSNR
jgi:pyrroline-5-carboxylate reductase